MNDLNYSPYIQGEFNAYISLPTYDTHSGVNVDGKWILTDDAEGHEPRNRPYEIEDICYLQKEDMDKYDDDYSLFKPIHEFCVLKTMDGHGHYIKGNFEEINDKIQNVFTQYYRDKKKFEKAFDEFEENFKNSLN